MNFLIVILNIIYLLKINDYIITIIQFFIKIKHFINPNDYHHYDHYLID